MKFKKFNGKNGGAYNALVLSYRFRYNEVINVYEYRKGKGRWKKYDDRVRNNIILWLSEEGYEINKDRLDLFIESDRCSPSYNPFQSYFKKLKKWDGKTDYIKQMSGTLKTQNQKEFEFCFKKFLVGTVDCLLDADSVNDTCLVFQAPQGEGKSRWMRRLLPKGFDNEYFWEGQIDTRNKDHTLYLSQYWFMHLDELEGLKNQDVSNLKSYITRQRISLRQAYGKYKSNFVRRASFIGSVNNDKFLTDTTGNRRWLVFNLSKIKYRHDVDVNKMWAQAYSLYKNDFRHWFNLKEIKKLNKNNEAFREMGLEEEMFLRYFIVPKSEEEPATWLSSSEILERMVLAKPQHINKLNVFKLGKVLSKYVKRKKRPGNIQKYYVVYLEEDKPSPNAANNDIEEEDDLPF